MARVSNTMKTRIAIDTLSAEESLKSLKQIVGTVTNAWKAQEAQFKSTGDYLKASEVRYKGLTEAMEHQQHIIDNQKQKQRDLGNVTEENSKQYLRFENDINRAEQKLASMSSQQTRAAQAMEKQKAGISALAHTIDDNAKSVTSYTDRLKAEGREDEAINATRKSLNGELKNQESLYEKQVSLLKKVGQEQGQSSAEYKKQERAVNDTGKAIADTKNKLGSLNKEEVEAVAKVESHKAGIEHLRETITRTNAVSDAYRKSIEAQGNSTKTLITKEKELENQKDRMNITLKSERDLLGSIEGRLGKNNKAYQEQKIKVLEAETASSKLNNELKETKLKLNKINPTHIKSLTQAMGNAKEASSKLRSGISSAMSGARRAFQTAAVGAGILTAGLAVSVKSAAGLQDQYIRTKNLMITGNEGVAESQKNMNRMMEDGRKYSVNYGVSQEKIAKGYQELIKRGYSGAQAVGAMKSMLEASVASGDDFNTVVGNTSATLESFGVTTSKAGKTVKGMKEATAEYVNNMAFVADKTATDFKGMGVALEYAGSTAHTLGIPISETSAMIGILSNSGLEAQKSGTGLRKVLNSLTANLSTAGDSTDKTAGKTKKYQDQIDKTTQTIQELQTKQEGMTDKGSTQYAKMTKKIKAAQNKLGGLKDKLEDVGNTKTKQTALQGIGIDPASLRDSNGEMKSVSTILEMISEKTKGMAKGDKAALFTKLFGTTGQQAGIILTQHTSQIEKLAEEAEKASKKNYVSDLAQKNMKTASASIKRIKMAIKAVASIIGAKFLPALEGVAEKIVKAFDSKAGKKAIENLGNSVADFAKGLETWVKNLKPDDLANMFNGFVKGATSAAKIAGKVGKAIGGMLEFIIKHKEGIKLTAEFIAVFMGAAKVAGIIAAIGGALEVFGGSIGAVGIGMTLLSGPIGIIIGVIAAIGVAVVAAYKHFKPFRKMVDGMVKAIKGFGKGVADVAGHIGKGFGKMVKSVEKWGSDTKKSVKKGWSDTWSNVGDWFNGLGKKWSKGWDGVKKKSSKGMKSVSKSASKGWKSFTKGATDVFKDVKKAFTKGWKTVSKACKKGIDNVVKGIKIALTVIKYVVLAPFILIAATMVAVWKKIGKPVTAFVKLVQKELKKVAGYLNTHLVKPIKKTLTSVIKLFKQIYDAIVNPIKKAYDYVSKWLEKMWHNVVKYFTNLWKDTTKLFGQVYRAIADPVKKAYDYTIKWFKNMWNKVADFFSGLWKDTKRIWNQIASAISDVASSIWNKVKSIFGHLKDDAVGIWNAVSKKAGQIWKSVERHTVEPVKRAWKTSVGIFNNLKRDMGNILDGISSKWHRMWNKMAKFFSGIWKGIKTSAKDGINGVVDFLNGGIGGINTVVHYFGGSKNSIAKIPRLAKGGQKTSKGGMMAVVNDEAGEVYREAIIRKTGEVELPTKRNHVTMLEQGDAVMPAQQTAQLMAGLPHYKNGFGDWVSGVWSGAKKLGEKLGDIKDAILHPIKTLTKVFASKSKNSAKGVFGTVASQGGKFVVNSAKDWFTKTLDKLKDKVEDAGSSSAPAGSGAKRWKSQVKKALKANGLSASGSMVNAWISQIQTESGGNEKAVQGGYTDINTLTGDLAKGLLQTISSTFNAFKHKGHGNIFNGYDNMLAAMSYAKSRYGGNMTGVIGHGHGYANGGIVDKHGMYEVAEQNKAEMIIPLDHMKRTRGWELLMNVASQFLGEDSGTLGKGVAGNTGDLEKKVEDLTDKMSILMDMLMRQKTTEITIRNEMDGRETSRSMVKYLQPELDKYQMQQGRLLQGRRT